MSAADCLIFMEMLWQRPFFGRSEGPMRREPPHNQILVAELIKQRRKSRGGGR